MQPASRARAFLYITAAYLVALAFAWFVVRRLGPTASPLAAAAWADLAATVAVFVFSVGASNSSVYDAYWSVAPLAIAPYFALQASAAHPSLTRQIVVIALVSLWGVRLTYNWARGFHGMHHEDWRYVDIRDKTGRGYWAASFFGLHLFPTVQVYLGCLPLSVALVSDKPMGGLDVAAVVTTLAAIATEAVADEQLRAFRRASKPGEIMNRGLWALVRHPNYLGEIGFWWGLYLFALACDPGAWWTGAGALSITLMFAFASIPLIDKRSLARRPGYAEHMKQVPALIPRFFYRR